MDKESLDFNTLRRLRDGFIAPSGTLRSDYWQSRHALEQYHATFAQRIGWKWESVLAALKHRGFEAPPRIVDYGCGSGIASLAWARAFATEHVTLFDRSALASQFAHEKLEEQNIQSEPTRSEPSFENAFVLLSHVAGELSEEALAALVARLKMADGFCWLEPGTPQLSRALISVRESLRDHLTAVAPCPHQQRCGLADSTDAWCHHFAHSPQEAFQSAFWKKFSDELGIDLRSLPTSFLVMRRAAKSTAKAHVGIGRPRFYKAYAHFWACDETGVRERKIIERKNARLFGRLEENEFLPEWNAEELEGSAALTRK